MTHAATNFRGKACNGTVMFARYISGLAERASAEACPAEHFPPPHLGGGHRAAAKSRARESPRKKAGITRVASRFNKALPRVSLRFERSFRLAQARDESTPAMAWLEALAAVVGALLTLLGDLVWRSTTVSTFGLVLALVAGAVYAWVRWRGGRASRRGASREGEEG